ncbi:MAG: CHAT domain-containing protein [Planctomycetota bacterium]
MLKGEGLIDEEGRVLDERALQLQFEPSFRSAVLLLRCHAALGELLEEREAGRELSPERLAWFEGELKRVAEEDDWVLEDRLRIFDRLAFEAVRRGDLERARTSLELADALLEEDGSKAGFTVTRLGLDALKSRLLRAEEAAPVTRLKQLERLTAGTEAVLRDWDDSDLRPVGLGFLDFQARRELLVATLIEMAELVDAEEAFELYFEAKRRGSLERRLGLVAPTLGQVRAALCGPDSGVLLLLRGQSELLIGVLDASTACFEILDFDDSDGAEINELRKRLLSPDPSRVRSLEEAQDLSRLVETAVVAERLREWSHVYVVGREFVRELPLGVLELDGQPLGLSKSIAYLPSTALGVALAESWIEAGLDVPQFWLGELDGSTVGLSDASLGEEAISTLRGSLPGQAQWLPFSHGAVEALMEADFSGASFATLFAHGRLDLARTRPAGLWIGPAASDTLWAEETAALRAAQVMVLSACGAARTNTRIGDGGIGSLGGALLEAGARSVVLASADVPRDGTVELTRHLQAHLAAGRPVAEALMLAKRELADSARFADPYQFANFHVLGVGHRASPSHTGAMGSDAPPSEASEAASGEGESRSWMPLGLGLLFGAMGALGLLLVRRRNSSIPKAY